jgi:kinesin family protein 2/24
MGVIQTMVAEDLYLLLEEASKTNATATGATSPCSLDDTAVYVTFFEIYGGRIQDLLNERKRLKVLEDGKGEVQITGLEEFEAVDAQQFLSLIDAGNDKRTTHATEANDTSSRSHAICQVLLRDKKTGRLRGKLSLVDLGKYYTAYVLS